MTDHDPGSRLERRSDAPPRAADALDARFADALPNLLGLGTPPDAPPLSAVLARASRPRRAPRVVLAVGVSLAVAAAALVAVNLANPELRARGSMAGPQLHLEAAAVGPAGVRPLGPGAEVGPEESVVFRARAGARGHLVVTEIGDSGRVTVLDAGWVAAGTFTPGGATPLGWRPEGAGRTFTYEAQLCPEQGPCSTDRLVLRWRR